MGASNMNGASASMPTLSVPPSPPADDDADVISSDPIASAAALRRLIEESRGNKDRFARIEADIAEIKSKLANVDRTWVVTSSSGTFLLAQSLLGSMTDLSPMAREVGVVIATMVVGIVAAMKGPRR
jgi:hypothetical protein